METANVIYMTSWWLTTTITQFQTKEINLNDAYRMNILLVTRLIYPIIHYSRIAIPILLWNKAVTLDKYSTANH